MTAPLPPADAAAIGATVIAEADAPVPTPAALGAPGSHPAMAPGEADTEQLGPLVLDAAPTFHRRVGHAVLTLGATTTLTAPLLALLAPLSYGLFERPFAAIAWPLPIVLELLAQRRAGRSIAPSASTASLAHRKAPRRGILLALALAAGIAAAGSATASPAVVGIALGLAFALDWTRGAPRRALRALVGALPFGVAAAYAAELWLAAADRFAWPALLGALLAGAVGGLLVGLGSAALHVGLRLDPVARAAARLHPPRSGTLGGLVERALAAHAALAREAPRRGVERDRVAALVVRVLEIATRAAELERALAGPRVAEIAARLDALDARIGAAADDVARAALREARGTLEAQARAADQVRRALARIEARLEAHVALLDRLAFAATFARSVDAERLGEAPAPAVPELEALSSELDATAAAVGEVYGRLDP